MTIEPDSAGRMSREKLSAIFLEHEHAYARLLNQAQSRGVSEKWGTGLPPLTLEPYDNELRGETPSPFLKRASAPAKNRFRYLFDQQARVVAMTWYSALMDDGLWMHADEVTTYDGDGVCEFRFASVCGTEATASLQRVTYGALHDGRIQQTWTLHAGGDYTEADFRYEDGRVSAVDMRLWYEIYTERRFSVKHDAGRVSITEAANGKIHQIYPRR
ncbi:hypothetical protein INH39_18030 [Massilia violaceinigra]|uniref:Uncharacterized protein n=1 Tax=Massilia violaceinigra TaxID=2045208 RepID=A0ABY3ZY91_9BURK|nr:hypothetical protein [Massilia violaceinigra]UOD27430.1 hypothetical protein INH39_18030 [Massilia violaceinigra]